MATAPSLVVAGDPVIARRLRETGRFPAVFHVRSATELRDLSRSGRVGRPTAFMFAPGFVEDVPGGGVPALANGLAGAGFNVVVHDFFTGRGDVFDLQVRVTSPQIGMSELLATFVTPESKRAPREASATRDEQVPVNRTSSGPAVRFFPAPTSQAQAISLSEPAPGHSERSGESVPLSKPVPSGKRGRVIAIASAKGGVGKTSTTVNLSVHAAKRLGAAGRGGRVALVDTDFQQADVARYLNLDSPSILDVLRTAGGLSPKTVRHQLAHIPGADLYALLGPPDPVAADPGLINSTLYRSILPVLREAFDLVFVDTPAAELYHTTFTDLILPEADAILVPVEPNRVTLEAAQAWLRAITSPRHSRNGGVAPDKLSLILNRARTDVDCGPEDVMDLLPGWRFIGMIPEDPVWMQAVNNRRLGGSWADADLDERIRDILLAVTGDPVFGAAESANNGRGGWRRLLGLGAADGNSERRASLADLMEGE